MKKFIGFGFGALVLSLNLNIAAQAASPVSIDSGIDLLQDEGSAKAAYDAPNFIGTHGAPGTEDCLYFQSSEGLSEGQIQSLAAQIEVVDGYSVSKGQSLSLETVNNTPVFVVHSSARYYSYITAATKNGDSLKSAVLSVLGENSTAQVTLHVSRACKDFR